MKRSEDRERGGILDGPQRAEHRLDAGVEQHGLQAEDVVARQAIEAAAGDRALAGVTGGEDDEFGVQAQAGHFPAGQRAVAKVQA